MSTFKDKVLLITGGTGSFGNAVLNRFLKTDIGEIRIFSRDERNSSGKRTSKQIATPIRPNSVSKTVTSDPGVKVWDS